MESKLESKWFVLHVLTGKELDVKGCLIKDGFKCLVPRRTLKERKDGVWTNIERLLFPSYVFVFATMDATNYYKLEGTTGVINILRGASNFPTPVTEDEMMLVFRLSAENDLVGISDVFVENENIKVVKGPLEGLEGNILKVDKRRFRAKVKFTIAGHEKIIELGVNVLDKI